MRDLVDRATGEPAADMCATVYHACALFFSRYSSRQSDKKTFSTLLLLFQIYRSREYRDEQLVLGIRKMLCYSDNNYKGIL